MSNYVAKVVEIVGVSNSGIEDAVEHAIAKASATIRHIRWFQVTEVRGQVKDGKVDRYQVMIKLGFSLDEDATTD